MRGSARLLSRLVLLVVPIGLVTPLEASAQSPWWFFENRPYFKPLRAAVRDAHVSATLGLADRVEFLVEPKSRRPTWDIDVGAELPILGYESRSLVDGRVQAGAYALGFWFPIDFHMIGDLFTDPSSPIINNDYRFGLMGKLVRGLSDVASVGARVHVGHESTHLGDEFSIVGQRTYPEEFERINVSWEFLDVVFLYEREWPDLIGAGWLGITTTLPFHDSYYSTESSEISESPRGPITPSRNWYDLHGGIEVERESYFFDDNWGIFASAEVRWRSVYDYHKAVETDRERRQLSTNLIVGIRQSGPSEYGRFSPFLRLYHGVNPHGQFRNQMHFTLIGFGFRLTH